MIYVFMFGYVGFMLGYPFLQLWTLLRCRGWWRAFAVVCLVPAVPLYAWAVMDLRGAFGSASLGALLVAFLGIWPVLYLIVLALGYEFARKSRMTSSSRGEIPTGVQDRT